MVTASVATAEELAESLRRASAARQSVVIRGAGTKWGWPRRSRAADLIISTLGLNRLLAHQHGDLTATIEAGATLKAVNASLARHGQWLPIDPSFADTATIGGILATNDAGPLRHRYGTPRDQVIGIRVATADGLLAKAGGQVVKNVAGYDLSKLMTGSFGTLAAIVSATFKLSPLPSASATLVVTPRDERHAGEIVRELMESQLEPISVELVAQAPSRERFDGPGASMPDVRIVMRFASVRAAVDAHVNNARILAALEGCTTSAPPLADTDSIWRSPGAILRANWLPANTAPLLGAVMALGAPKRAAREGDSATSNGDAELVGRAVVGAGLIRIGGDEAAQARGVEQLDASGVIGNIVVLRGSDAIKERWGVRSALPQLAASLKHAFDPQGILC
jgi:glycolate dehydrogenase FAD-binding subunit